MSMGLRLPRARFFSGASRLIGWAAILSGLLVGGACTRSGRTAFSGQVSGQHRALADLEAYPSAERFLQQSGLNLPWISYGHDVGWPRRVGTGELFGFRFYPQLLRRRAALPEPMHMLRVWMLADDRAGNLAGRDPEEFTVRCVRDLSSFMEDVGPKTRVIWVLYDFMLADGRGSEEGGRAGEHRKLVTTAEGARRALKLVAPCVSAVQAKYGDRIIWDVFNEPLNGRCLTVTDDNQQGLETFLRLHMEAILKMGGRVTLGARNLQALRETWAHLWRRMAAFARTLHLPPERLVVQFHHYPGQELDPASSLRTFHADALRRRLGLDRDSPVLLGESWPLSGFTLADYLARGFAGGLFWQDARLPLPLAEVHRQIEQVRRLGKGRITSGLGDLPAKSVHAPIRIEFLGSGSAQPSSPPASLSSSPPASLPSSLDLSSCRIVPGPPATAWWRRRIGAGALAFTGLVRRPDGSLEVSVQAESRPPDKTNFWWTEKHRTGFLLCDLPARAQGWDLTGQEIQLAVTPPDPRLCGAGGCGMQVVVADITGRTMHGPWTGVSAAHPGRYELTFRPAPKAVPGIGYRQSGFDLHHVHALGLLWSGATFASFKFSSKLLVQGLRVRPLAHDCRASAGKPETRRPAGPGSSPRSWCDACYQSVRSPRPRILHPASRSAGLSLSCRMRASDYPYFQGVSLDPSGRNISLHLASNSAFARRGALWSRLTRDCRVSGRSGIFGSLLDLHSSRIELGLAGEIQGCGEAGCKTLPIQLLLGDDSGRTCYVSSQWVQRNRTERNRTQGSLRLLAATNHPLLCTAGSVDLGRIARLGLVFGPAGWALTGRLTGLDVSVSPLAQSRH